MLAALVGNMFRDLAGAKASVQGGKLVLRTGKGAVATVPLDPTEALVLAASLHQLADALAPLYVQQDAPSAPAAPSVPPVPALDPATTAKAPTAPAKAKRSK